LFSSCLLKIFITNNLGFEYLYKTWLDLSAKRVYSDKIKTWGTLTIIYPYPVLRIFECQNPSFISDSIGIPNGTKKMEKKWEAGAGLESYSYRRGWLTLQSIDVTTW